jgi:hypothetical protein
MVAAQSTAMAVLSGTTHALHLNSAARQKAVSGRINNGSHFRAKMQIPPRLPSEVAWAAVLIMEPSTTLAGPTLVVSMESAALSTTLLPIRGVASWGGTLQWIGSSPTRTVGRKDMVPACFYTIVSKTRRFKMRFVSFKTMIILTSAIARLPTRNQVRYHHFSTRQHRLPSFHLVHPLHNDRGVSFRLAC